MLAALPLVSYSYALAADLQNNIRDVPEESIRAALEKTLAPKYREGVFEHSENALEALHSENPELASKVVDVAKYDLVQKLELLKRQTNVTTVTESNIVVDSTTIATTAVVVITTSVAAQPSTSQAPASTSQAPASTSQPPPGG